MNKNIGSFLFISLFVCYYKKSQKATDMVKGAFKVPEFELESKKNPLYKILVTNLRFILCPYYNIPSKYLHTHILEEAILYNSILKKYFLFCIKDR